MVDIPIIKVTNFLLVFSIFSYNKLPKILLTDVKGPTLIGFYDHLHYYVIFVNYFTTCTWFTLLSTNSMSVSFFNGSIKLLKMFFKLQSKLYILTIMVKLAHSFCYHLFEYGIQYLKSPPYLLELVTIVKCKHYHIVQTTLRLLHYRSMPLRFWSLAYQTIMYLINRMSTSMLNFHSFFDKIFNKTHNYHQFCIFGYLCYLGFIHTLYLKLKLHWHLCAFVGHSNEHHLLFYRF